MAYNSANRSERLLQNRRFTTDGLTLSQEAFTSVLDINATEIYTQQNYIPTASAGLPFSGSSQNGLIVSASVVQPGISPDLPILRYWYRKKMKPSADGTQQAYYFTTSDPSSPTNTVTSDQLIETDQQTNFISPKYIISANSSFNAEANPPGYKVVVYKSTSATAGGVTEAASLDSTYVFDYKTGVLSWVTGNAPASNQYVYITAYQYVGEKLDSRLTSLSASIAAVSASGGAGAGFPFSGSAVITGSLLVIQGGITGSVSGTFTGDGKGLSFVTASFLGSSAITNNTNNNILTATGGGSINGESNLTFDGSTLVVSGNTSITGDLTVAGTASFVNAQNLNIADQFIAIASSSNALVDSGIVSQYNSQGSGSAFYLEATNTSTYGRWAVAYDVVGTVTSIDPDEFVVTAKKAAGAPPASPTWGGSTNGYGNIYINSSDDSIYIYV